LVTSRPPLADSIDGSAFSAGAASATLRRPRGLAMTVDDNVRFGVQFKVLNSKNSKDVDRVRLEWHRF
jgi:hypothetical protein